MTASERYHFFKGLPSACAMTSRAQIFRYSSKTTSARINRSLFRSDKGLPDLGDVS